ncbi:hypothetical protein AM571_PC00463 (plasmid) [Rhizobium etli 8C-3]|uniref:Uncharacterized protein n=1 Tax=Rhizobium etli 8C-3 TaxID=538025 RepID=A0A1L5PDD1_RHIET|nr:hypothetical protein AM571_PC00463 [Rhizobium etli 8C-3]
MAPFFNETWRWTRQREISGTGLTQRKIAAIAIVLFYAFAEQNPSSWPDEPAPEE